MPEHHATDMSDSTLAFVTQMTAVFGAPDTGNAGELKRILNERVGDYPKAVMQDTASHFIETRRSWPKLADIITVAANKDAVRKAGSGQSGVKRNLWADAENFTRRWFEERADPDLIDRADFEGWRDDLFNAVRTMAHSILRIGNKPERADIRLNDADADYYRDKARRIRAAAHYRETPEFLRAHGTSRDKQKISSAAKWLVENARRPPSGAAIRAHMGLEGPGEEQ